MNGDEPTIDLASLGTFTPDDPEIEGQVATEDAPAPEKKPGAEPEPEKKPAAPAEPDADDDDGDDEFEDLSLEDIETITARAAEKAVDKAIEKHRAGADEPEGDAIDPKLKQLAEENERSKARIAELENESAEREAAAQIAAFEHSINSTIGKLKLSDSEVEAVTKYMVQSIKDDPGNKTVSFEEFAMRRFPGIGERAKAPAPTSQQPTTTEGALAAPAANGSGAPRAFKHTASPGDYDDVNDFLIRSGKAAGLGKHV